MSTKLLTKLSLEGESVRMVTRKPFTRERESATPRSVELRKELCKIHGHSAHARLHPVLVFAQVISLSSPGIRQDGVSFYDKFELLLVTALSCRFHERDSILGGGDRPCLDGA